jgi:cytochrome c553
MNKYFTTAAACAFLLTAGYANAEGNAAAGKEKSTVCAACHGADGNSATPDFPKLAGQNADYMVKALSDYKSGARKNPIMGGQVANLSKQDMEDLAAYFSSQTGLTVKY